MIHLTVICRGRAVPLLWKVLEPIKELRSTPTIAESLVGGEAERDGREQSCRVYIKDVSM